jgi:hypothetical protein
MSEDLEYTIGQAVISFLVTLLAGLIFLSLCWFVVAPFFNYALRARPALFERTVVSDDALRASAPEAVVVYNPDELAMVAMKDGSPPLP